MAIEVFFSYSHKDEGLRAELEKQLSLLKRQDLITGWHDRRIVAGQVWAEEIDAHLNTAQIILLLISSDFMASDYCYGIEMKRAMERHERGEAHVIPIVLRPVYWKDAPFGKLQALPTDAQPVTSSRWHNLDDAFFDVAEGIRRVSNKLFSRKWREEGKALSDIQHYDEALAAYEQALHFDSNDAITYEDKANTLKELGRYDEALAACEQAIQLGPDVASRYMNKTDILMRLKRYDEALTACDQALQLDHKNAVAYRYKGNLLWILDRHDKALDAYREAKRLDPKEATHGRRTTNSILESYPEHAEEVVALYKQAIRHDPDNVLFYKGLINILEELGHCDEAIAVYDQLLAYEPDDISVYWGKIRVLEKLGRYEGALIVYEELAQLVSPDASFYMRKAKVLEELKCYDKALTAYEQVIRLEPLGARAYWNKALVLEKLERNDEALATYEQYNQLVPNGYHSTATERASLLDKLGRYKEAASVYEQAIHHGSYSNDIYRNWINILKKLNDDSAALIACEQAIRKLSRGARRLDEPRAYHPQSVPFYKEKANLLNKLGRHDEALAIYDQLGIRAVVCPSCKELHLLGGKLCSNCGSLLQSD
jgi:tetratricopeptide (TPR) repeat protein